MLKFEYPTDIMKELEPFESDGEKWVLNPKKFHEIWTEEYKERTRFLDLALAIEQQIDMLITRFLTDDSIKSYFIEEVILNKVTFEQKVSILASILKEELPMLNKNICFENLEKNVISISKFKVKTNKLLDVIKHIKNIRNHTVHSHKPIFNDESIILNSKRQVDFNEIGKEETLIKGHFALWLLQLTEKKPYINEQSLITYYHKYNDSLKSIGSLVT